MRIRLFDADRTDRELTLEEALAAKVSARQLLWVDLVGEADREELRTLARRFDLDVAGKAEAVRPSTSGARAHCARPVSRGLHVPIGVLLKQEARADKPAAGLGDGRHQAGTITVALLERRPGVAGLLPCGACLRERHEGAAQAA